MLIASHPGQGHIIFISFNVLAIEYFVWQECFWFILRTKQVMEPQSHQDSLQ